jgi:plastocyanin
MTGRSLRIVAPAGLAIVAVLVFAIGGSSAKTARTAQASKTYNFRLSEFNIGGPTRLQAGQTTLKFWDAGRFQHNFTVVAGPDTFGTKTFNANETGSLSRDLKPGAYLAICTVRNGGHMANGMVLSFTVGTQDQQTGQWHA